MSKIIGNGARVVATAPIAIGGAGSHRLSSPRSAAPGVDLRVVVVAPPPLE